MRGALGIAAAVFAAGCVAPLTAEVVTDPVPHPYVVERSVFYSFAGRLARPYAVTRTVRVVNPLPVDETVDVVCPDSSFTDVVPAEGSGPAHMTVAAGDPIGSVCWVAYARPAH